jgi:hypothetical protein
MSSVLSRRERRRQTGRSQAYTERRQPGDVKA